MASATLKSVADLFGVGAVVGAYVPSGIPGSSPISGAAVTTGTVLSDGSLTFTGLEDSTNYVAYLDAAHYRRFNTTVTAAGQLPSSGIASWDFGAKTSTTFTGATKFEIPAGSNSGSRVKEILARSAVIGFAVDIVLLPGTHLWDAQPALAASAPWTRIRGSGKAITTVQTKDATSFSVGAEGGGERLVDLKVTADHQTFGNIVIEDLTVDVVNSFGLSGAGHVVIGTQRFTTIQQRVNVKNVWVRNVNTVNVPFDPTGATNRSNVSFYVHHPASNEATQNTITNVHVEGCNFSGGSAGVLIGGHAGAVVPATSKLQANVWCDEIFIRDFTHDMKALLTGVQKFVFCSNIQVGDRGMGGRVVIDGARLSNSIDVGVELDSILDAQVTDVDVLDCRGPAQIAINYNDTLPTPEAQRIVYTRCKSRQVAVTDGVLKAGVTVTSGSAVIVVPDATGLQDGQVLSGAGIPYNTTIAVGGISGTNVTMSAVATANGTVPVNFATWQPKGFMLGVYSNSVGATAVMGHVTYRSCEWHRPAKTNMTKGEAFYCDGTPLRSLVVNDFKMICDGAAVGTATASQKLFWARVTSAETSGGRASVSIIDLYARLAGTVAGGEIRVVGVSGVAHVAIDNPTFSLDLTGTAAAVFPLTLADDASSSMQGRVKAFRTEKLTNTAGFVFWGPRCDGGSPVNNMVFEDIDCTQYPTGSGGLDRLVGFNTDAQALGTKLRNIRSPIANQGEAFSSAASVVMRDWVRDVHVTDTSAARTITLPKAARSIGEERRVIDLSNAAATNNITIQANAADTIQGGTTTTTAVINTNGGAKRLVSNGGTKWNVV